MNEQLAVEGRRPTPIGSPNKPEDANRIDVDTHGPKFQCSDETKQEVYSIAEKILAAAADKSSGETEKKLIAAVMAVHMKYAESLHVIENLIQDRKKIDDRVKFLEGQLKKGGKGKAEKTPKPPGYNESSTANRTPKALSPSLKKQKANKDKVGSSAAQAYFAKTAPASLQQTTGACTDDQECPTGGDETFPQDTELETKALIQPQRSPAIDADNTGSDCEDELYVINEGQEPEEDCGLPPAYDPKMKKKPMDPLRSRKMEIKARLQELYEMPPSTRGATPKSSLSVFEAFPARPQTAPTEAAPIPVSEPGDAFSRSVRRPSTACGSSSRRRKMSVKDEIESLEQELYEVEQKIRFKKASKVGPAEFKGMKERDEIMRKRAEDRLEKSRQLAEAAEKLRQEEEKLQEKRVQQKMERAKKSLGVDEAGNPLSENWEDRLEREKIQREERKLKHKATLLAQRVPLTSSLEESINVFKDSKGKHAPEPGKIKVTPFKATDPAKVAARIAREAEKLEVARVLKEKANEDRIRSLTVAPDHPMVIAMKERERVTKERALAKAQEQKKREDEAKVAHEREEKERFEAIKAQRAPEVKPTNAQISRDLEVKRAEEARLAQNKRKEKEEEERIERQKLLQRTINAAKKKDNTTSRIVLGNGGEPLNSGGGKQRPTLTERFDQYHRPHLHV